MKTRKLIPTANRRKMKVSSTPKIIKEYPTEENEQAKPLFLIMQKIYFDQIEKVDKIEEYRDDTAFYRSRLLNKTQTAFKKYNTIILQEGYTKEARRMIVEVKQVTLNRFFTIHLGKILERQNF